MAMETKALGHVEVKDGDRGVVEAVFSKFNVRDLDGDVTLKEAFIPESRVKISSYNHGSWESGQLPVGVGTIEVRDDCAVLKGKFFMNTSAGRETFEAVKGLGDLAEWSYGFVVADAEFEEFEGKHSRILKKVNVFEISPVLKGAGIGTGTLDIKSAGASFTGQCEQVLTELESLTGRGAEILVKRREEGKGLGGESRELLTKIDGELETLKGLLFEPAPEPESDEEEADDEYKQEFIREHLRHIASQHGLA
ncbi:HK97 family phage prohead protease [Saccharopolyspora mangrovi]|uniref:HK97 family phage prohead protease n=1 Tax=Saccharopolyspora mangrovi TaxID=3082379 RepID=A0ABU6A7Q4_9PSEU|nr:HK97 family phage prohead protease [Saccharopolyspora sp. S2-29]MEB3367410.1 HK97 family phage prohead protease [Saccharopolyspora sp. S2-29]